MKENSKEKAPWRHYESIAGARVSTGVVAHPQIVSDLMSHHVDGREPGAWVRLLVPVPHPHLSYDTPVRLRADPRDRRETHREMRSLAGAVGSPEVDSGDKQPNVPMAGLAFVGPQIALELAEGGE